MAGPGNILITVGASTAGAVRNLQNVNQALGDTQSAGDRLRSGLQKAALPAAVAFAAVAAATVKAAHAAIEHQAIQEHLATSLRGTTGATDAQIASVQDYIKHTELATGVNESSLAPAFEKLARATGSTSKATELMNQSLDISAATGKDVNTVAIAVAKAYQGQYGPLIKLAPGLSENARKSKDFNVIMGELSRTMGGSMAASTTTVEGKMRILHAAQDQLWRQLGEALIPVMLQLIPILTQITIFTTNHAHAVQAAAVVVAVLSGAILAANVALKAYDTIVGVVKLATDAWKFAQLALNASLLTNPVFLITAGIIALGIAIVIAYRHSETFRSVVHAAFSQAEAAAHLLMRTIEALAGVAVRAAQAVGNHWRPIALLFGPLGVAVLLVVTHFHQIQAAAGAAGAAIRNAIHGVIGVINAAIGAVRALISALGRIHVPSIHIPHVPGSASFAAETYAVAGAGGYAYGATYVVNVTGAIDPEGTARAIRRVLQGHDRRMGRTSY